MNTILDDSKVKIESTFYSDGTRQIIVSWQSKEGERKVLHDLEDLINEYFIKSLKEPKQSIDSKGGE